jgi:hypothetical protein
VCNGNQASSLALRDSMALPVVEKKRRSAGRHSHPSIYDEALDNEKLEFPTPPESTHSTVPQIDREEEPAADPDAGDESTAATRVHSVNHVDSIPNGGFQAWLQVLGAFFLFFNSWYVWMFQVLFS